MDSSDASDLLKQHPAPKIALASWSFNHEFEDPTEEHRMDVIKFVQVARDEAKITNIELLYSHLLLKDKDTDTTEEYVQKVAKATRDLGVGIVCLAVHNNFVEIQAEDAIKFVKHSLDIAKLLNCPLVRINAGTTTFCNAAIDTFLRNVTEVISYAKELNISITLENQGGITLDPYNLLDIILRARQKFGTSPKKFGICLDIGNFTAPDCVLATKLYGRGLSSNEANSPEMVKREYIKQAYDRLSIATGIDLSKFIDLKSLDLSKLPIADCCINHIHAKCYSKNPTSPAFEGLERDYDHIFYQMNLMRYQGYYSIEFEGFLEFERECHREPWDPIEDRKKRRNTTLTSISNMVKLIERQYNKYVDNQRTGVA